MFLSVVSPVYKADSIILKLVELINTECVALEIDFEIILVNDGSPDNSWNVITEICALHSNIIGINLTKNFGQHASINAGLAMAKGNYIIVMDCDLQHNPKYIPQLLKKIQEGSDIVFTVTSSRNHSGFKNIFSKFYHVVYNYLSELESNYNYTTYSILSARVLEKYKTINDYHSPYLPKLRWMGFKQAILEIEHNKRADGKSGYSVKKLFIQAINGITSHSTKLLRINIFVGLLFSVVSFIGIAYIVFVYFTRNFVVGWASIVTLILFSLGVLLTSIGIVGLYIGQTFEQVKNRPQYIVSDVVNN
jgi:dolichol-phosphate mannosyltransferase